MMDGLPKISVVTVVKNDLRGFAATALNICSQDYPGLEWIVIDGGSTDGTVEEIRRQEGNICFWVSEPDGGFYDAMNKGVAKATGGWVIFMNAGDLFTGTDALSRMFCADTANADVVYGDCIARYPGFSVVRKAGATGDLWKGMNFSHQSAAVRTVLVREYGFREEFSIGADYDLFCRLLHDGKKFIHVEETVASVEAFGISHRKMAASARQHYNIIRQYKKLTFSEHAYHAARCFLLACITLAYKLFPRKAVLLSVKRINKQNLADVPSSVKAVGPAESHRIAASPVTRMVNYGRGKIDMFRTFRLKLIVSKVLYMIRLVGGSLKATRVPSLVLPSSRPGTGLKIGMIDNSYHSKTVSSFFLTELLKDDASFEIFWDAQWNGGKPVSLQELNARRFDLILIWQVFLYYRPEYLRKLKCRNVVIIPMYDDAHTIPDHFFRRYLEFPFISFSVNFQRRFEQLGIRSACFRYFMDPSKLPFAGNDFSRLTGFFWQRNNDITWEHIRKLIDGAGFSGFHLHLAIDPLWYREVLPPEEDMMKYNITISRWFDKKEDYLAQLSGANVFFAPRLYEGIGMPFIEAMTMGMVVVAPDHPTMNEYIVDGKNGLLYDMQDLKPLDFTHAAALAAQAREDCFRGYEKWQKTKTELLDFIQPGNLTKNQ